MDELDVTGELEELEARARRVYGRARVSWTMWLLRGYVLAAIGVAVLGFVRQLR